MAGIGRRVLDGSRKWRVIARAFAPRAVGIVSLSGWMAGVALGMWWVVAPPGALNSVHRNEIRRPREDALRAGEAGRRYARALWLAVHSSEGEARSLWCSRLAALGQHSVGGLMELADYGEYGETAVLMTLYSVSRQGVEWYDYPRPIHGQATDEDGRAQLYPWLEPVLGRLCRSEDAGMRSGALFLTAEYLPPVACVPLLLAGTRDVDRWVRAAAFGAMLETKVPRCSELTHAIVGGIADRDVWVRSRAVETAIRYRVQEAVPALLLLLSDEAQAKGVAKETVLGERSMSTPGSALAYEPPLSHLAAYAIQQITGKDFDIVSCYDNRDDMDCLIREVRLEFGAPARWPE